MSARYEIVDGQEYLVPWGGRMVVSVVYPRDEERLRRMWALLGLEQMEAAS